MGFLLGTAVITDAFHARQRGLALGVNQRRHRRVIPGADHRWRVVEAASGMRGTFFNSGSALSIGTFFSAMIVGLSASLSGALRAGPPPSTCP
ncbi:MAG TPA: hypothetical protein VII33_18555, partial [Nakamurella sp.]